MILSARDLTGGYGLCARRKTVGPMSYLAECAELRGTG
ncbi:hypothetical protein FIU89_02410 [Roseovarius sp. THAF27]|nr:hypothetical protein FIU89_02410 [Roseovarius sp. THAF27]